MKIGNVQLYGQFRHQDLVMPECGKWGGGTSPTSGILQRTVVGYDSVEKHIFFEKSQELHVYLGECQTSPEMPSDFP